MAENLTTTNRYFNNKHHPRGFSRHSDFATKEAQLLERHGYVLNELDLGERESVIEEERFFVVVCCGEHEPVTEVERVWSKYTARIKRPKRFRALPGGKLQAENAGGYTDSDD